MEVDWGGKLRVNHIHECMPSEVHWGDHDPSLNPMDEHSIYEVDWGAHDSRYFLYLVYIDLDAKPKDFFIQELWGGLPQRTSSTPLISLNHVEGKLVHHLALQKGPNRSPVGPTLGHHTKSGPPTIFIRYRSVSKPMPEFDHYSLVGRTFLLPPEGNGEKFNFHLPHGISEICF